jgi:FlaA1/EpsC-like NDP-sugar epimerase
VFVFILTLRKYGEIISDYRIIILAMVHFTYCIKQASSYKERDDFILHDDVLMNTYANKTVLITGASSGIGLAMAKELAHEGATLVLVARSTDKLEAIAKEIQDNGGEARVFTCDLSVLGAAEVLYKEIQQADIDIDILINNAGYGRW